MIFNFNFRDFKCFKYFYLGFERQEKINVLQAPRWLRGGDAIQCDLRGQWQYRKCNIIEIN